MQVTSSCAISSMQIGAMQIRVMQIREVSPGCSSLDLAKGQGHRTLDCRTVVSGCNMWLEFEIPRPCFGRFPDGGQAPFLGILLIGFPPQYALKQSACPVKFVPTQPSLLENLLLGDFFASTPGYLSINRIQAALARRSRKWSQQWASGKWNN